MCDHAVFHKEIIAQQQDLSDGITYRAIPGNIAFEAKIVKADGARLMCMHVEGPGSVAVDDVVAFARELQGNLRGGP